MTDSKRWSSDSLWAKTPKVKTVSQEVAYNADNLPIGWQVKMECGHTFFHLNPVILGEEVYCYLCPHLDGGPLWSWLPNKKEVQR